MEKKGNIIIDILRIHLQNIYASKWKLTPCGGTMHQEALPA